jgi:predicted Zn finger-like uncharacterized protein
MFTVCPKCALTLVVTAADLRVAQGYVRCGRCSSVFNALARLADERQAAGTDADGATADLAASQGEAPAATAPPPSAEEDPAEPAPPAPDQSDAADDPDAADEEAIPEDALEFNPTTTDVTSVFVEPPPNPQWTAATGSFKAMVAANQEAAEQTPPDLQLDVEIDAAFLASMLKAENPVRAPPRTAPAEPVASATPVPAATPAAPAATPAGAEAPARLHASASPAPLEHATAAARHARARARPAHAAAAKPAAAKPPAAAPEALEHSEDARSELDSDTPLHESVQGDDRLRRLLPLAWRLGAGLAVVALLAQIVNHYRDELAATTRFNRSLTALYAGLGVHLVPRWDLHAYDVRQLGASVDPAGTGRITVRASIKNAAPQPQPLPLLRVTLQDRFGNRIASSDVAPQFYLPRTIPASAFLSAGQRIDAQMGFVDPGTNAVGFELDACLPASGGGVACANDASAR